MKLFSLIQLKLVTCPIKKLLIMTNVAFFDFINYDFYRKNLFSIIFFRRLLFSVV